MIAALREDAREDVCRFAVDALGKIGPAASSAVPDLIALLSLRTPNPNLDPNSELRRSAADALGGIGVAARAAIPALRKALQNRLISQETFDRVLPKISKP